MIFDQTEEQRLGKAFRGLASHTVNCVKEGLDGGGSSQDEDEERGGRRKEEERSLENAVGQRKRTLSARRGSGKGRSMWEREQRAVEGSRVGAAA